MSLVRIGYTELKTQMWGAFRQCRFICAGPKSRVTPAPTTPMLMVRIQLDTVHMRAACIVFSKAVPGAYEQVKVQSHSCSSYSNVDGAHSIMLLVRLKLSAYQVRLALGKAILIPPILYWHQSWCWCHQYWLDWLYMQGILMWLVVCGHVASVI